MLEAGDVEIDVVDTSGIVILTSGLVDAYQITFDLEWPHAPCVKKTLSGIAKASFTASSRLPIVAFKPVNNLSTRKGRNRNCIWKKENVSKLGALQVGGIRGII